MSDTRSAELDKDVPLYLRLFFNWACLVPEGNLLEGTSRQAVYACFVLLVLFTGLTIVSSKFFSVNVLTISKILKMQDTVAGVTLLALGNGSPDILASLAAVKAGLLPQALGELFGSTAASVTLVTGLIALFGTASSSCQAWVRIPKPLFYRDITLLFSTIVFVHVALIGFRIPGNTAKAETEYKPFKAGVLLLLCYLIYAVVIILWDKFSFNRSCYYSTLPLTLSTSSSSLSNYDDHYIEIEEIQVPEELEDQEFVLPEDNGEQFKGVFRECVELLFFELFELRRSLRGNISYSRAKRIGLILMAVWRAPVYFLFRLAIPVSKYPLTRRLGVHTVNPITTLIQAPVSALMTSYSISRFFQAPFEIVFAPCLLTYMLFFCVLSLSKCGSKLMHLAIASLGFMSSLIITFELGNASVHVVTWLSRFFNTSGSVLGLTVQAAGFSLGDIASNLAIAKSDHPVMALTACFAAPLQNILLGLSLSLLIDANFDVQKVNLLRLGHPVYLMSIMLLATLALYVVVGSLVASYSLSRTSGYILVLLYIAIISVSSFFK